MCQILSHLGVGLQVLEVVVVHHAQLPGAKRLCDGHGDLGFGVHQAGAHFLDAGEVFLFQRDGHRATFLGLGLGDVLVGVGLVHLELGSDVHAHFHIGDVDGEDFEGGVGVEGLVEDGFGNAVGVFEDVFVAVGGADGGDDAFADAGDDGFLGGAADEAVEVGADGDAGAGADGDAVLGDAFNGVFAGGGIGGVDDLGIDGGFDGFEDGFAGALGGEVDGAGAVEDEVDAGFAGGDEGLDDEFDIAAGEVVGGEVVDGNVEAGFDGRRRAGLRWRLRARVCRDQSFGLR